MIAVAVNSTVESSFDDIVQDHWPSIFYFVLASVRDWNLAEDLTQDCFSKAFGGWNSFRGDSTVNTWLRHIALNVIRNSLRSKGTQFWRHALSIEATVEDYLMDKRQPSPEAITLHRETVRAIWKAAEKITLKQRLVLQLRFARDLGLAEIAVVMGITESAAKVDLFRAVRSVRKILISRGIKSLPVRSGETRAGAGVLHRRNSSG